MGVSSREKLKELAGEYPEISAWLKEHGSAFQEAIRLRADDEALVLLLAQLPRYVGRQFPIIKGRIDQARWHTLGDFVDNKHVDPEELKIAVLLLLQAFSGACDAVAAAQEREMVRRRTPQRPGTHRPYWPKSYPRRS